MTKAQFIAERFRDLFLDGKWIANTNYREQLLMMNREQATRKIGNLNTIAALTFHVNYYLGGLLQVLKGGGLDIRDKYSFDLPAISTDEDWINLRDSLITNAEKFATEIEHMDDGRFDQVFVDEKYGTYWRNLEGVIEHGYYHLGQISLIRKMQGK